MDNNKYGKFKLAFEVGNRNQLKGMESDCKALVSWRIHSSIVTQKLPHKWWQRLTATGDGEIDTHAQTDTSSGHKKSTAQL